MCIRHRIFKENPRCRIEKTLLSTTECCARLGPSVPDCPAKLDYTFYSNKEYHIILKQLPKILYFLPTEIIDIIQSYLIQKIPKSDYRYMMLDRLYYYYFRPYAQQKRELLWKSREHRGWLITFIGFPNLVLLIDILPRTFIEYSFQNLETRQRGDYRFWLENQRISHLNLGPTTQPINA